MKKQLKELGFVAIADGMLQLQINTDVGLRVWLKPAPKGERMSVYIVDDNGTAIYAAGIHTVEQIKKLIKAFTDDQRSK